MKDTKKLLSTYVRSFNATDDECVIQAVSNDEAEEWLMARAPRIAVPDAEIEKTYYFRWWTYRKHVKKTPEGYVMTEFHPDVAWAGKYNTIPCACTFHMREGRWLRENGFLDDYMKFWYRDGAKQLHVYSNAFEAAIGWLGEMRGDDTGLDLLDAMENSYELWKTEHMTKNGLYWSHDGYDGSEYSISGHGLRATLNSYQYVNALAIARLLRKKGEIAKAEKYEKEAAELKKRFNELLWDEKLGFYRTIPQKSVDSEPYFNELHYVRELWDYIPWLYGTATEGKADAFRQLLDERGFFGKCGLTTAERRHPCYGIFYTGEEFFNWLKMRGEEPFDWDETEGHECLWHGPSWPFATCTTLGAVANLLVSGEKQDAITKDDYLMLLHQYAAAHKRTREDGVVIPWIDEDMNPDNGDWISRTRLSNWHGERFPKDKGGYERGKDYNHSTFCDLVLEGLFGVRPDADGIRFAPLFPAEWEYAQVDDLLIHGHNIGVNYEKGKGYCVYQDGEKVFENATPTEFYLK